MNDLLNDVLGHSRTATSEPATTRRPRADLQDNDDEYTLTIELPGVEKDDISLSADGHTITVSVSNQTSGDHRRTRRSFYRQLRTPRDADTNEATATYNNGVLELRLPKQHSDSENTIPIQ